MGQALKYQDKIDLDAAVLPPNDADRISYFLLGDRRTRKAALLKEVCGPGIEPPEWYNKDLVVDDVPCMLDFYNITREDKATLARKNRVQNTQCFILIYSVTSLNSFGRIPTYHLSASLEKEQAPDSRSLFVLVGAHWGRSPKSKSDGPARRLVSIEEGKALAQRLGCSFYEMTSETAVKVMDVVLQDTVRSVRQMSVERRPQVQGRDKWNSVLLKFMRHLSNFFRRRQARNSPPSLAVSTLPIKTLTE